MRKYPIAPGHARVAGRRLRGTLPATLTLELGNGSDSKAELLYHGRAWYGTADDHSLLMRTALQRPSDEKNQYHYRKKAAENGEAIGRHCVLMTSDSEFSQRPLANFLWVSLYFAPRKLEDFFRYDFRNGIGLVTLEIEFPARTFIGFDHDADFSRVIRRILKQAIYGHDAPPWPMRWPRLVRVLSRAAILADR